MPKYKQKPVIVEAVQYIKGQEVPAVDFLGGYDTNKHASGNMSVHETDVAIFQSNWFDQSVSITLKYNKTHVNVNDGDYIVKLKNGQFIRFNKERFEKFYELIEDDRNN